MRSALALTCDPAERVPAAGLAAAYRLGAGPGRAWTCDCRSVFFELCHAGGMAFVCRTVQKYMALEVTETHRMRVAEGRDVWEAILVGMAR